MGRAAADRNQESRWFWATLMLSSLRGPALRGVTTGEKKEQIVHRMWNQAPQMWSRMGSERLAWPRFEAGELAALLGFLGDGWNESSR